MCCHLEAAKPTINILEVHFVQDHPSTLRLNCGSYLVCCRSLMPKFFKAWAILLAATCELKSCHKDTSLQTHGDSPSQPQQKDNCTDEVCQEPRILENCRVVGVEGQTCKFHQILKVGGGISRAACQLQLGSPMFKQFCCFAPATRWLIC